MIRLSIKWDEKDGFIRYDLSAGKAAGAKNFKPKKVKKAVLQNLLADFNAAVESRSPARLEEAGKSLLVGLLTPDVVQVLQVLEKEDDRYLQLHLSQNLIEFPFELMFDSGGHFLAERFHVGREVVLDEPWNRRVREPGSPLKVLISSNPAGLDNSEDVRTEAENVSKMLEKAGFQVVLATDQKKNALQKEIRKHDLVLFIGHSDPAGWLVKDGNFTAVEVEAEANRAAMFPAEDTLPAGIIANSCASAASQGRRKGIDSLCTAFLRSAVLFYVGTFWDIPDAQAGLFSQVFFERLTHGSTLGEALGEAREALIKQYSRNELIWASYVLYGSPDTRLTRVPATAATAFVEIEETGPRIANYTLGNRIFSTPALDVFNSWSHTSRKEVTLGLTRSMPGLDHETQAALERLNALEQSGLPRYRKVDQDDGRLYLVYDRLQGRSLQDYLLSLAGRPAEEKMAVNLLIQLCETFSTLHRAGYFHGALSPEHIYLLDDENGGLTAQVWGAGFQSIVEKQAAKAQLQRYTAPEQSGATSPEVDIWAIGAIGYHLLVGRPFGSDFAVADNVAWAESLRALNASGLPPRLVSILHRALSAEPKERMDAGIMAQALRNTAEAPTQPSDLSGVADELLTCLKEEGLLVYITCEEEERAIQLVAQAAESLQVPLYAWSASEGLVEAGENGRRREYSAGAVLNWLMQLPAWEAGILLLKDFHEYIDDPEIIRRLIDLHMRFRARGAALRRVVMVSPILVRVAELRPHLRPIQLPPPDLDKVMNIIQDHLQNNEAALAELDLLPFAWQALGLTEVEIRHALDLSLAQRVGFELSPEILREQLLQTKREAVTKSGLLEFEMPTIGLGAVGGLHPEILPALVSAVQPALDSLGFIPIPKGWLLVGVPGSGKSLAARAIAGELRLPLLRLDLGRLFGGFLGDTESNTYRVIEICEQLSPLVLWIDEFEKGFAGQKTTGSGTVGRMWAIFLNWLQERQAPVLMVATANQLQDLPAEIFRVGRFDAILFFDTPGWAERENLWEILLGKFGLKSLFDKSDLVDLVNLSEGAAGAEVEQAVLSAMYDQMAAPDRDFGELLRGRLKVTKPLWRENTEQGSRGNQELRARADGVGASPVNGWYHDPLPPGPRLR